MNQTLQQQITNQPSLFKRAQEMANGKTTDELQDIARNICATKGLDYEKAYEQFQQLWNGGKQ